MAPVICKGVTSKKSLLALGWTVTTALSLLAFITAFIMTNQIHRHYNKLAQMYAGDDDGNYYGEENSGDGQSGDGEADIVINLATMSSSSITFAGLYTACLAFAIGLYGSVSIVGTVSMRGNYIAPFLTGDNGVTKINVGMFMGALVIFSNLCLVCAVVLGEFRVEDYKDRKEKEEFGNYAVENVATVLGVMCMFLAILHFLYAILLFTLQDVLVSYRSNIEKKDVEYDPPSMKMSPTDEF